MATRGNSDKSQGNRTATKPKKSTPAAKSTPPVTRFAHPFFTTTPQDARKPYKGETRMTDHIEKNLEDIPPVKGTSVMTLADIVGDDGATQITGQGQISFQTFGDTGHEDSRPQQFVADAASQDYNIAKPAASPAFLLHLGDVIYYDNTDRGYHAQFYSPYKTYPGKIIAIPGNHDGELFKYNGASTGQTKSLQAFQSNFCQPPGKTDITSGTILRHMVSQPGVYWRLNAPFVDIVGLYSNVAENPGYIESPDIGTAQKTWLDTTLATIQAERAAGPRKALMIAVHHPPISNGSHGSSVDMLADIDDSCNKAKIMPDMVLAAHSHDYQRYTRFVPFAGRKLQTPYVVVGTGGRGLSTKVAKATGQTMGDHRYDKSLLGYGYLTVTVSPTSIAAQFTQVDANTGKRTPFDQFSVDLATAQVT